MRRALTILTAIALSLASLAIGLFTADLPFWSRALRLPLAVDEVYLPVATIGADTPAAAAPPPATALAPAGSAALESVVAAARAAGSRALLVMRHGELVLSRYFGADDAHSLLPAGFIARPVVAMAMGVALGEGRIESLDAPVAQYLPEWDDEPRGHITLRQLLEDTSGLESGGDVARLLRRSPWDAPRRLPLFATAKGVRMLLGNDFETTALRFSLQHEPGGFHNYSPANAQLAAVILERATRVSYEHYVDAHLWRPVGAGAAQLPMDRRAGMPAAHCCWRAAAPDVLRIAGLLATDGMHRGRRILPEGWVREMARASRVNTEGGLQLERISVDGVSGLASRDDSGGGFWVFPDRELVIVNIVNAAGGSPPELPALLLQILGAG